MTEDNQFFTFDTEEKKSPSKVEPVQKPKKEKSITGKLVDKIMVNRSVDKEGNVCTCWADKDTISPDALHNYDKYKEFY